ncbi:MAG: glycosyltransferase family 2 protein [Clostridiales bacterium]|jgi:glycosyltransferase involved in cell wall biosynthesis|nr:glycosyltransferase family 2 protein [Clostridiales bacterium]
MPASLSLVMAGYNEEKNVKKAVEASVAALDETFAEYEIILIDDGSRDGTARIMDEMAALHPRVRAERNYANLNFGASVLRGLLMARCDYAIYNAMDLPLDPRLIKDIVREAEDGRCDVLVLERESYAATGWRKLTSSANLLLLRLLFPRAMRGTPVVNYIQLFRREIIRGVLPLARSPIFVWPEMIFRAKYAGLRVGNRKAPVQVGELRKGAFGKPHDIMWGLYDMARFRVRKWTGSC